MLTTAREYAAAVRKTMDIRGVFLYGSHVRGEAKKDSDIDIAVVANQVPGDYLDTMASLWRLTNDVDESIEPVLLLTSGDESGFLDTVRRTGIEAMTALPTVFAAQQGGGQSNAPLIVALT